MGRKARSCWSTITKTGRPARWARWRSETAFNDGNWRERWEQELSADLFSKAVALLEALVQNHPFVDDNKRTGITAAAMFLRVNGHKLTVSKAELERFTFAVVREHPPIPEIAAWFKQNSILGE